MIQETISTSDNGSTTGTVPCCTTHSKLQSLKQKKSDLESLLNEKNKLLELIMKEEQDLRKNSNNKIIFDDIKRRTMKNSSLPASPLSDHKLSNTLPGHGKATSKWNDNDHLKFINKNEGHSGSTNAIHNNFDKLISYPQKYYQYGNVKTVVPGSINTIAQQYLSDKDNNNQFINTVNNKNAHRTIDIENNEQSINHLGNCGNLEQENILIDARSSDFYCIQPIQIPNNQISDTLMSSKGLGGYWISLENNERIWVSNDDQPCTYVSRKNSQIKRSDAMSGTKSSSVGNFLLLSDKCEDTTDSISLASFYSENKKQQKEKKWSETLMDGPTCLTSAVPTKPRNKSSNREKNKLSSQSMLLPNRSNIIPIHYQPVHQEYPSQYIPTLPPKPSENNLQFSPKQNGLAQKDIFHSMQCVPSQLSPSNNTEVKDILIESPKNVHVIQHAKIRPYKEISKPFEMSDFYKYSTKYRQMTAAFNADKLTPTTSTIPNQGIVDEHLGNNKPGSLLATYYTNNSK